MRLVDADELILKHGDDITNWDKPCAVYISSIENAPTIEAEPIKHAKWERAIRTDSNGFDTCWFRCSECYEDAPKNRYGHDYFSKRCPRCGSHMTIESEATDE